MITKGEPKQNAPSSSFPFDAVVLGFVKVLLVGYVKCSDVHYLVTQGAVLSRSNVIWFEHNDMAALEVCLQTVNEGTRRATCP